MLFFFDWNFLPLFCLNDSSSNSVSKTASAPVFHVLNTHAHDQKNWGSEMGCKINNDEVVQSGGYAAFHSVTQKTRCQSRNRSISLWMHMKMKCGVCVCACMCCAWVLTAGERIWCYLHTEKRRKHSRAPTVISNGSVICIVFICLRVPKSAISNQLNRRVAFKALPILSLNNVFILPSCFSWAYQGHVGSYLFTNMILSIYPYLPSLSVIKYYNCRV